MTASGQKAASLSLSLSLPVALCLSHCVRRFFPSLLHPSITRRDGSPVIHGIKRGQLRKSHAVPPPPRITDAELVAVPFRWTPVRVQPTKRTPFRGEYLRPRLASPRLYSRGRSRGSHGGPVSRSTRKACRFASAGFCGERKCCSSKRVTVLSHHWIGLWKLIELILFIYLFIYFSFIFSTRFGNSHYIMYQIRFWSV